MAEIGIVLASLAGANYFFTNHKEGRLKQPRNTVHKTQTKPVGKVGTNIYNNRDYYKVKDEEAKRATEHHEAAQDPLTTGVIPMYYNTLHIARDAEKVPNKDYNEKAIFSILQDLDTEAQSKIREKTTAIHDADRRVKPEWGVVMDRPMTSKLEGRNDASGPLDQIGGSLNPNADDFSHQNMVPFYKGSLKQNMALDNRCKEGKLETYTGQFKLNQDHKKEVEPLFKPEAGQSNIYGHTEKRDISRYRPSNTGKRHNELPFEQERVGPGTSDGFTSRPSGGFHNTTRIMPKSHDELHVDPVKESEGRVTSGHSQIGKRTMTGQMYKYRPELLVENKNGERNFTTTGACTGRTLRPEVILRDTNRKKSKVIHGHAKSTDQKKHGPRAKHRKSKRQNFDNTPHRNATSQVKQINDHGKSGFKARANNRDVTGTRTHLIAPKGSTNRTKRRLDDKARKTRKQHYVHNSRTYGNSGIQKPGAGPSYNPGEWVAKPTIRETTEDRDHLGFTGVSQKAGQAYNSKERAARTTIRETTEDQDHLGFAGVSRGAGQAYNTGERVARTTIRETTENNEHQGWFAGEKRQQVQNLDPARKTIRETTGDCLFYGNAKGPQRRVIAVADQARTTIRETTEDSKHIGVATPVVRKHIVVPKDQARTTIRETTEDSKHIGVARGNTRHVAQVQDQARTTIRETTENNKHLGQARGDSRHRTGLQDSAKNTNRQFTSDYEYTGAANAHDRAHISYDNAYNMRQNINKENIARGRRSMGGGPRLGHQQICIEVKKMDDDRRSRYTGMKSTGHGNMYNPNAVILTSERNHLPQHDTRLDVDILSAYKSNPLAQSLNSSW